MKPFKKRELAEKFWDGSTSLEQEKHMKANAFLLSEIEQQYFRYTKSGKECDIKLEDEIWKKIQHKNQRKLYLIFAAAASLALLVASTTYFTIAEKKMKQEQNFALLEETLNHVSVELSSASTPEVIYSDENLFIVAEN